LEAAPEKLRKAVEEEEAKRAEAAALFDIDEFITAADTIREVYVPAMHRRVKYKPLTIAENAEAQRIEDPQKRAEKLLFFYLHKADEKISEEKIKKMLNAAGTTILTAILADQAFLFSEEKKT
jgi:hypothetical protein